MKCYSFIYEKLLISSQTETFLINSSPGQNEKETRKKNQNLSQIMPLLMIKY